MKHPLVFLEVLKHALLVLEVVKQKLFNTIGAEPSAFISRRPELTPVIITGTKTYQLIFGHDRSLIYQKIMAHITGLHDVIPS